MALGKVWCQLNRHRTRLHFLSSLGTCDMSVYRGTRPVQSHGWPAYGLSSARPLPLRRLLGGRSVDSECRLESTTVVGVGMGGVGADMPGADGAAEEDGADDEEADEAEDSEPESEEDDAEEESDDDDDKTEEEEDDRIPSVDETWGASGGRSAPSSSSSICMSLSSPSSLFALSSAVSPTRAGVPLPERPPTLLGPALDSASSPPSSPPSLAESSAGGCVDNKSRRELGPGLSSSSEMSATASTLGCARKLRLISCGREKKTDRG